MQKTVIIAEAGVNHNGDLKRALQMVRAAADCGVDYIKFQTFRAGALATQQAAQADYQKQRAKAKSQYEMLKKLELSGSDHARLMEACNKAGIGFLSSAFDLESLRYLDLLKLDYIKIPSGEITNLPYLSAVARLRRKTILSTGMATMKEIKAAIDVLYAHGLKKEKLSLLHCTTEYPCPFEDVNLRAMLSMGKKFGLPVGYSDHTAGIAVPLAAVAFGACIIEKHFTLDRRLPGPDHAASLEPDELKAMVEGIRQVELALGDGQKKPVKGELKNLIAARKSIHTARAIKKGERIKESDLVCLRPGDGLSPMKWEEVVGKKASHDLPLSTKIKKSDLL